MRRALADFERNTALRLDETELPRRGFRVRPGSGVSVGKASRRCFAAYYKMAFMPQSMANWPA